MHCFLGELDHTWFYVGNSVFGNGNLVVAVHVDNTQMCGLSRVKFETWRRKWVAYLKELTTGCANITYGPRYRPQQLTSSLSHFWPSNHPYFHPYPLSRSVLHTAALFSRKTHPKDKSWQTITTSFLATCSQSWLLMVEVITPHCFDQGLNTTSVSHRI